MMFVLLSLLPPSGENLNHICLPSPEYNSDRTECIQIEEAQIRYTVKYPVLHQRSVFINTNYLLWVIYAMIYVKDKKRL